MGFNSMLTPESDLRLKPSPPPYSAHSPETDCRQESITLDDGVDQCCEKNCKDLERLREFEPDKRHHDEDGVVEEAEEGKVAAVENGDEGASV
ncbi:hypothetical protein L1887_38125 [Cichorium endivia]|nr:hypothetical protein L1887_38125 [Cichorium endivia]